MTSYDYIIVVSYIISFNLNCIVQLWQFYNIDTTVSSRKKCHYIWWSTWLLILGLWLTLLSLLWARTIHNLSQCLSSFLIRVWQKNHRKPRVPDRWKRYRVIGNGSRHFDTHSDPRYVLKHGSIKNKIISTLVTTVIKGKTVYILYGIFFALDICFWRQNMLHVGAKSTDMQVYWHKSLHT